ncbi:MAG: response regulator transcription factor [Roseibacillus sp.]
MKSHSARILLVEDETPLRIGLTDALEAEGHRVIPAADGEQGLTLALTESPDLILLDLMLPKLDGFAICREIRKRKDPVPILMLTARGLVNDRVNGLDAGADDYLVKPFSLSELTARVRALLRRLDIPDSPSTLTLGNIAIDFASQTCLKDEQPLALTHKELGILQLLAETPNQPVSRETFLDRVWSYGSFPTTRTVDNHIATLRKKIETDPAQPQHLLTAPGIGYQLHLTKSHSPSP